MAGEFVYCSSVLPQRRSRPTTSHTRYDFGMANTRKVTVTIPESVAATLEQWRAAGQITSVSEYVTRQLQAGMDRAASLRAAESVHGGQSGPKRPPLEFINRGRQLQGLAPLTEAEAEAISAEAWATAPGRSGAA
uniref:hypothetical protein n=1 Tax=Nocardia suismassiliense TaxID=2077092 RepID=UPI003F495937